jgi:hypothetical protein
VVDLSSFLTLLKVHFAIPESGEPYVYTPQPGSASDPLGWVEPMRIKLWLDTKQHIILRSEVTASLYKGRLKEYRSYYLSLNIRESLAAIRTRAAIPAGIDFVPIKSVEPLTEEPVYDIEVEGAHNFIANGIVVHNSRLTMKYPAVYLMGRGAHGEVLSVAFASDGQHQDAGAKMIHAAPDTSSVITSKSISKGTGRTSYRGLVKVYPGATNSKSTVRCDALLLNPESRSDTYPTMEIDEKRVQIGHEATVSKIGDEQLFYAMSRGLTEQEAMSMIVNGFIEPFVKELPLEYAVELNRLVQLEMEGAVG